MKKKKSSLNNKNDWITSSEVQLRKCKKKKKEQNNPLN